MPAQSPRVGCSAQASAAPGLVTALLGALVVVLEGVPPLYEW